MEKLIKEYGQKNRELQRWYDVWLEEKNSMTRLEFWKELQRTQLEVDLAELKLKLEIKKLQIRN